MDAAQQNVRYHNTATLGNVRTVIILEDPGARLREKSPRPPWQTAPEFPKTGNDKSAWKSDRKLQLINQHRTPINSSPRKKAGSKLLIFIWKPGAFNQENTVIKKRKINI